MQQKKKNASAQNVLKMQMSDAKKSCPFSCGFQCNQVFSTLSDFFPFADEGIMFHHFRRFLTALLAEKSRRRLTRKRSYLALYLPKAAAAAANLEHSMPSDVSFQISELESTFSTELRRWKKYIFVSPFCFEKHVRSFLTSGLTNAPLQAIKLIFQSSFFHSLVESVNPELNAQRYWGIAISPGTKDRCRHTKRVKIAAMKLDVVGRRQPIEALLTTHNSINSKKRFVTHLKMRNFLFLVRRERKKRKFVFGRKSRESTLD